MARSTNADGVPVLHTANLVLVPKTLADVRAEIAQMDVHEKAQLSADWLARVGAATNDDPWVLGFSIMKNGAVIGSCGFKAPPDADGMVEIAYGIAPNHQNKGYATQAAEALVRFASANAGVRIIRAHTMEESTASARVLTKCGFRSRGQVIDPDDGLVWRWEREKEM